MAIKKLTNEDFPSVAGEYCYIQRVADGFIMENSASAGHTPGAFYSAATVTDKMLPLTENVNLPGVYESTENRIAFDDGKYIVRYCQSDGTIIAIEDWDVVGDAVTGAADANIISQANIDFGALQKASITAAVPTAAAIQSGLATAANQVTILAAIAGIPAAVWAVTTRTLSSFGTLVADVAAAVWAYATRTITGVTGSISYAVISGSVRDDYITALGNLVGGDLPLGETEKIFAINAALKKYSGHRPRIAVEDEDGTGGFDYQLSLLTEWTDGFSTIKSVEYPVDDTVETAAILQEDAWTLYQKPSGKCLRFLDTKPPATEDFRVTYTTLHVCSDAACTIPPCDEEAVQILAAALFCDMLAAYFSQTQDSTIRADSVDHKSKGSEYAARARAYRKMYFDHLGIKEGETPAASVTKDQDLSGSWAGDKMTHPHKFR